jgi:hypothetical protein
MDQFSFCGPFAYRWIDDVPVERIDLRSGERLAIEVISSPIHPGLEQSCWEEASEAVVRSAMAAWN